MKSEDSPNEDLNEDNEDSNLPFSGKAPKIIRKNVMRRKNANVKLIQQQQLLENRPMAMNEVMEASVGVDFTSNGTCKSLPQIILPANASYHRVQCTIRQSVLNYQFAVEYSNSTGYTSPTKQGPQSCPLTNCNMPFTSSVEHLLDEELKFGPLCSKNIPRVVSLGLNVVLDIIKDSYQQNPSICIRSLESLSNLLTGLKPESLKYEPPSMIEKFFDLILSLISMSQNSICRKFQMTSTPSHCFDNFQTQVKELSISILITLSIARGDTTKILSCIKTLLIDCNCTSSENSALNVLLDNFNVNKSMFSIEVPDIMVLFKKNVCFFLLGRLNIPEWFSVGFPMNALCETFTLNYAYHRKNLSKHTIDFKSKSKCAISLTFDGQHLIMYRCNRLYLIGSGYNSTPIGQELFSSLIDISISKDFIDKLGKCCSNLGWVGFIGGDLFLQPYSSWSLNRVMCLDAQNFKLKYTIPVIQDNENEHSNCSLSNETLATTDGDFLILLSAKSNGNFTIRELKPHKAVAHESRSFHAKERVSFLLSSNLNVRLSTVCVLFCGNSAHNLSLPWKSLTNSDNETSYAAQPSGAKSLLSVNVKLLDTNSFAEHKYILNIVTGKDFALMITEHGKVYYSGNAQSLGIRHTYSFGKWSLLSIPKPVRIIQVSTGHDGNHALLLGEDGTIFFVGTAKRGEDGESAARPCHRFSKPSRIKKFAKMDFNLNPSYVACNNGTSAIISKSGELYLFGKDSYHCNSRGLVSLMSNELTVKSVALGKAHLLILTTGGMVITSGLSNKGQCGLGYTVPGGSAQQQCPLANIKQQLSMNYEEHLNSVGSSLKSISSKYLGHLFVYGKTRTCSNCSNCTEFGTNCPNSKIDSIDSMKETVKSEVACGCGEGNSGCIYCGICSVCSKDIPICKRVQLEPPEAENSLDYKSEQIEVSVEGHSATSSAAVKSITESKAAEFDFDSASLRISSVPPTILPLSTTVAIVQIAAGLHHSVLLTDEGNVYTFGSNQFGQLGLGDFNNRFSPTKVKTDMVTRGSITQIAAGSNHTILLSSLGEVLTFGSNQNQQLGRSCYNSCKFEYPWNTFPAKMDNVGPEFGRIATSISANGDFTFVKNDEMFISSSLLTSAKLVAEKSNLILVPPQREQNKSLNNFDQLFEERSCKHQYCIAECSEYESTQQKTAFNNLNSSILIVSRVSGSCTILNPSNTAKISKLNSIFNVRNQLCIDMYSHIYLDSFYNNLWIYNPFQDEFARFNLIELEASSRMAKVALQRSSSSPAYSSTHEMPLPTSLMSLNQLNALSHPTNHFMHNIPSALQSDITVPLTDYSGLRQSPQQLGIEMLSFLTSLTYSHLLGISVNDKIEQLNYLTHTLLPEEYLSFCRFEEFGGGWGYPPRSVEAIRFSSDSDIIIGGFGLFGGRGEYTVQLRLLDIGFDGGEVERDGDLLTETDSIHYECLPRQKYQIFLDDPVLIQANRWYVIWASISGPSSDCGSNGQPFICTADQVVFHFKPSKLSNNGTDVNSGQIPMFFYKPIKSNEFHFSTNNSANYSLLSLDEEGMPFYISKDFVLKINSACIYSLCDLLRHTWNLLKALFHPDKLNEVFAEEEEEKLLDKLTSLISEIKGHIYVSCFVLELIRAYVQTCLPCNKNETNDGQGKAINCPIGKCIPTDYEEYQRISQSFFSISSLLSSILTNPIEFASIVMDRINSDNYKHNVKQNLLVLVKLDNFFIDECHQTFLSCTHAFYPTNHLKWFTLCDLLSGENQLELADKYGNLFSNRQLYLLSAVIKAFCVPTLRLVSFFPTLKSSITESNDVGINNESSSRISDFFDVANHVISKKTTELPKYDDLNLGQLRSICASKETDDYTSQFVFDNLLSILVKPIKYSIVQSSSSIEKCVHLNQETKPNSSDYRPFASYFSENNSNCCDVPSLNLSVGNSPTLSNSTTSSSSTFSLCNDSPEDENKDNSEFGFSFQSAKTAIFPNNYECSIENSVNRKLYRIDSKMLYSKKLIDGVCNLLIKYISELNACSLGLLNSTMSNESSTFFGSNPEFITPSRFCRRSSSKSWDTGSGTPEAICFSVNKSGIYISGVSVYAFSMGQLKYQLQLLNQVCDDNKDDQSGNLKWQTLSSVSGILTVDDNPNIEFCELRFERPVRIQANVKYAIVFKNFSIASFSGDMGLPQVFGDDETLFTFMDCSLSKNGTNLSRGQIPQILYYSLPTDSNKAYEADSQLNFNSVPRKTVNSNSKIALHSIISMFKATVEKAKVLLQSCNDLIAEYTSLSGSAGFGKRLPPPRTNSIQSDAHLFELIFSVFESAFFKTFFPSFIFRLQSILSDQSLAYEILVLISSIIPLISMLSKMIDNYFSYFNTSLPNVVSTTSSHYLIVESDHPYKPAQVTSYLVRFPPCVQWMSIEFDLKSSTAQDEDYLELYIPFEFCQNFSSMKTSNESNFNQPVNTFRNLANVYPRFGGRNFASDLLKGTKWMYSPPFHKQSSNCIYVPGNEIVFMLKTSSDYVHTEDSTSYYGFKAQVIGYETSMNVNCKELNNGTNSSEMNKEAMFQYAKLLIQNIENDIVYLFGLCASTLLNSSSKTVIAILNARAEENSFKDPEPWLRNVDLERDIDFARQIFFENESILQKSLNFDQSITMKSIQEFDYPVMGVNSFLSDFIKLTPDSSGSRLALWFQSESFISPKCCIVNTIREIDFCCNSCCQFLGSNFAASSQMLCSRCHYQLFVKTIPQMPDRSNVSTGQRIFIKIVTRDQHEEIAYDQNACIIINIRFVSPFEEEKTADDQISDADLLTLKQKGSGFHKSTLLNLISANPYQITVNEKCRFHAITMMKAFEEYTLEELRYKTHNSFKKEANFESIPVKSFENGYYLAKWTPTFAGCYKIELVVDGESNESSYLVYVNDMEKIFANSPQAMPLIQSMSDEAHCTKIKLDQCREYDTVGSGKSGLFKPKIRHCIRKFVCHDSAGLRIRALPSLQSVVIGTVAVNGLLTIIDQFSNDDGMWVRLSNESIQAYCSSSTAEVYVPQPSKDLFLNDNFEVNLNEFASTKNLKTSLTFTMRTEAWTLQFNRHFNRTLLVPIHLEDDRLDEASTILASNEQKQKCESFSVPSWFQVSNCAHDGHIIRNSPNLLEVSVILGIVHLNDVISGVEALQNEFGIWIRLSCDSLQMHVGDFFEKSCYLENEIDGWMLAQSINGITFLRSVQHFNFQVADDSLSVHYPDVSLSRYTPSEPDDNCCHVQAKHAISNSAAQCIRAIFAAFVWHEGILHDVLTAASYLKFNAEITKDYIKEETLKCDNEMPRRRNKTDNRPCKKANRAQKAIFRHSVEVSQLLSCWSSDVNSNLNDILNPAPEQENNNNNNPNNNYNNNNYFEEKNPNSVDSAKATTPQDELAQIPEILIKCLKIWDMISTECLHIFTTFNTMKKNSDIDETLESNDGNFSGETAEACDSCGLRLQLINELLPFGINIDLDSNQLRNCDCMKYRFSKKEGDRYKSGTVFSPLYLCKSPSRKYCKILNVQQLYSALNSSSFHLLSLVPSNAVSLTGISATENQDLTDKSLLTYCENSNARLLLEHFQVNDSNCFQSLHHLGIQKSVYEQKLVEEKLSDLVILSLHTNEDYQQLLSPECFDNFKSESSLLGRGTNIKNVEQKLAKLEAKKSSFKFYRSISVGMNDSHSDEKKSSYKKYMYYSGKHIKSSETLDSTSSEDKFNMPFLCKPSSKLINLVQECANSSVERTLGPNSDDSILSLRSPLFHRDVFRFIFSCYNIEMYTLVLKSCLSASAYRSFALNALNWLLLSVSSAVSLHDIMWTFVFALMPECESTKSGDKFAKEAPLEEVKLRKGSTVLESSVGAITSKMDVCRHPFSSLEIAGEAAESWITESLRRLIKSISNLLPLLPVGSPLQQMAIRCFGIDFQPKDHIFLHECKVFSHISAILTRASAEELNVLHQDYDAHEKFEGNDKENVMHSLFDISIDATWRFEFKCSSRQSMASSLTDNSTETFWESGNEDRNKTKHISILKSKDETINNPLDTSHIKFICVYIDNNRDSEYKVSQVVFKIMMEKSDALKYCVNMAPNLNLFSGCREIEFENVHSVEVDATFCGWIHCDLTLAQSYEIISSFKYLRIELNGPYPSIRVRQLKALSVSNFSDMVSPFKHYASANHKIISLADSAQVQTANCEAETLRVFRLLTSQVFGKLLSSELQTNSVVEKRSSFYQNGNGTSNNENDLREHMVGILFSQSGKLNSLSSLQKQVCSHIVKEIHCESRKVQEEWECCHSSDDCLDSYLRFIQSNDSPPERLFPASRHEDAIPVDAYIFELLSLVLALSGSDVGCSYLAKQENLFFDILTLLHTSSDRVKRQVLSLIRRVIPSIKPSDFIRFFALTELPCLGDIFARTHRSLSSVTNMQSSLHHEEDSKSILQHFGVLDIFLSCIAKSLTVTSKIKGSGTRFQVIHSMFNIFKGVTSNYKQWWLKGFINRNIAQSIILLLKDMLEGAFGKDWAEVSRVAMIEKILNLTQLSEHSRLPEQCIQTPTLWLALASLCVLDEKDAEMLSSSNLSKFHDQANGNSSKIYCDNHDDGETFALIQCNICGNLCVDCDRFLHLNTRTRSHKRHIFKQEIDSIKVDIHEGCGRAKFFWALIVADSHLLKAMVEFRVGNVKSGASQADPDAVFVVKESTELVVSQQCRFCGADDARDMLGLGFVCSLEDCQRFAKESCTRKLECSHFCHGIANESTCLPCLHGCSSSLRQDGDDMCMVCFSESLFAAPCIQLACNHVFHWHCIRTILQKRWSGGRISFNFSQCPICKVPIEHPSLLTLLENIQILYEDVKRKSLMRLEYEGLHKCKAITTSGGRFYNDPIGYAFEKYSYYLCFKCEKAYFGGEARCDADLDASENFNPEELICGSCSDVSQAQICPKHGTDYLDYKCRFCCGLAVYFCFGTTHFCNSCHEDFQRLVTLKDYPKCPVGPKCIPLEGEECPLHVNHPPTGEEFALGCGICRNAHTF